MFTYITGSLRDYDEESRLWGSLPVSSVRRVTAVLGDPVPGDENKWLVDMLENINFLELLELGGYCGRALGCLRRRLVRGVMQIDIRTLIVRGGEHAKIQVLRLENAKDDIGLQNMTVTYIPDPGAYERAAGTLISRVRVMMKVGERVQERIRIGVQTTMTMAMAVTMTIVGGWLNKTEFKRSEFRLKTKIKFVTLLYSMCVI